MGKVTKFGDDGEEVTMKETPTSHQPEAQDDVSMADAGEEGEEGEEEYEGEEEGTKVRLLPGSTPTAASFEFLEENHTLGNALRYVIMKNPDVEFCAYAIPHPSEAKMNVRIQTYEGTNAVDALRKGLRDIQDLCDVVSDKFLEARKDFTEKKAAASA
ncbi:DNA-directed RNA polymerase [Neurospora tetraspora]|uniref:DNA-directed RNA polymerases I and III subunit RPAC2 n=1 Tax=Neurospora tetraspora TaxID=94610 RepID=A0AAE0MQ43_9PEZI|nr:DNA-directed RNA polymerase [Neurospora tetraspora]